MARSLSLLCALALTSGVSAAAVPGEQRVLATKPVKEIPPLGFGTWNLKPHDAADAVSTAIQTGFRHIDAAAIYGNEKQVGRGIEDGLDAAGIRRDDIWVTSKLWNTEHAPSDVPRALNKTLADLNIDYVDLYLMHWPVANTKSGENSIDFLDTWAAMTKLLETGRARHIGVSNFSPAQLKSLMEHSNTKPYAHQFEIHPYLPQTEFVEFHAEHGIHVTAYSPLGNTNPTYTSWRKQVSAMAVPPLLQHWAMLAVGQRRSCSAAQVALSWGMVRNTSVIPKATTHEHIREDFAAKDCEIMVEDAELLSRVLPVKRFNNPSKGWGVHLYDGLQDSGPSSKAWQAGLKVWDAVKEVSSVCSAAMGKFWRVAGDL